MVAADMVVCAEERVLLVFILLKECCERNEIIEGGQDNQGESPSILLR
jgi:hypothetical protein